MPNAATIWRDFEVDGNPISGARKPAKSEIRAWGTEREITDAQIRADLDATTALVPGPGVIDGLRRSIDELTAGVPSIGATERVVHGRPGVNGDPVTGSNASAGWVVDFKPMNSDGITRLIRIFSGASATVELWSWTRNGAVFTQKRLLKSFSVVAGLNSIVIDAPVFAGEYIGAGSNTAGWVTSSTGYAGEYFYATFGSLSSGAITDSNGTTANTLQYQIITDAVSDLFEVDLLFDALAEGQTLGMTTFPTTGSAGIGHRVFFAAPRDGIIDELRLYSFAAASVVPGIYTISGGTVTRVRTLEPVNTVPGLNVFSRRDVIRKDEFFGLFGATSGWCTFEAGNLTPYYLLSSLDVNDSAALPALRQDFSHAYSVRFRSVVKSAAVKPLHEVSIKTSDQVLIIGQSFEPASYVVRGKSWPHALSRFTDYVVDIFAYGGRETNELLDYLRQNLIAFGGLGPQNMGNSYVVLKCGKNDFLNSATLTTYLQRLRQMVRTVRSLGAEPIVWSELDPIYGAAATAGLRQLCDEERCRFISTVPVMAELIAGTAYAGFFQGSGMGTASGAWHPGVRTSCILSSIAIDMAEDLPRPAQSLKVFRKRDSINVTDLQTSLLYGTQFERDTIFQEIYCGHVHFNTANERKYDEITAFNVVGNTTTQNSEKMLLASGQSINVGTHCLIQAVIDAVPKNTDYIEISISDPTATLYVRDAIENPYQAVNLPPYRYVPVLVTNGVARIGAADLPGKLDGDEVVFLLVHPTGAVITEPRVRYAATRGKVLPFVRPRTPARGAPLIRNPLVNPLTGWTQQGSPTLLTTATTMFPAGITGIVTNINQTNTLQKVLDYAVDNSRDREIVIRALVRYFPAIHDSAGVPAPLITPDTLDERRVYFTLSDDTAAVGNRDFTIQTRKPADLWWNWVEARAIIPRGVAGMKLRISADPDVQLASFRCDFLEAETPLTPIGVFTLTGSATIGADYAGQLVRVNSGTASTITLAAAAPVGTSVDFTQAGAGQVQFAAESGATLRHRQSFTRTAGQHAAVTATVVVNGTGTAAEWLLSGDMVA